MYDDSIVTYFAETDSRNKRVKFGIKAKDRTKHVYVIGKTGMGKSTVLENMAVQDIQNGEGMAFIDPHGKTADLLLDYIPEHRKKDVVYFAPFDLDYPISFNVLEQVDPDKRHLVVSGLMSTFKKIWQDAWSARMEYILTNTLLALLEYPGATLLGVNRMYSDKEFRKDVVAHITDPTVKAFWTEEFAKYTDKFAAEATPAIQNKIGQFTSNALIRNMIGQPKTSFDLRKIIDEKKILIINLSKGRVGEQNANLLGGMLITKIYLAAMSRADASPALMRTLPQFYLYVDEFQSFANESFADILSEARKYKLNLTMAHQYIEQMEEEVRAAVFGNVGTMMIFRVGAYDAEVLEKEFAPTFTAEDIVNLGVYQIYIKLMIDGISSQPFSATTLPPIALPPKSPAEEIKAFSRAQFSHTRPEVEKAINEWMSPIKATPPVPKPSTQPQAPYAKPPVVSVASKSQTQAPASAPPIKPSVASATPKEIPLSFFVKPSRGSQNQGQAMSPPIPPRPQSPVTLEPNKPIVSRTSPKPQPAQAKPFAEAFKTMEKDSIPARAKQIEGDVEEIPSITLVKDPNAQKSVPLASLSPAASKTPTPERVNELKAALAKAMEKSTSSSIQVVPQAPKPPLQVQQLKEPSQPPEVPEDILKKTLKVE
jgi:energy-coupling factor transporter ATP-binding protein EcfA2